MIIVFTLTGALILIDAFVTNRNMVKKRCNEKLNIRVLGLGVWGHRV